MKRIRFRFVLALLLLAGLVFDLFLSHRSPSIFYDIFLPQIANCIRHPTVDCLADAAYEIAAGNPRNVSNARIPPNLAETGHCAQAEQLDTLMSPTGDIGGGRYRDLILACKIIVAARDASARGANLDFSSIGPYGRKGSVYQTVVLDLLNVRSESLGVPEEFDEPAKHVIVAPAIARPLIDKMMADWKAIVQTASPFELGDMARVMIDMGDQKGAEDLVNAAQVSRMMVAEISSLWLRLGRPDKALNVIADSHIDRPTLYLAIAEEMQRRGASTEATDNAIRAAFVNASDSKIYATRYPVQRETVRLMYKLGDRAGASELAETLLRSAENQSVFPSQNLLAASAAFIDLGETERARVILDRAIALLPKSDQEIVGSNFYVGPISFAAFHTKDATWSDIAAQNYRLGDVRGFESALSQVAPDERYRAWVNIMLSDPPTDIAELALKQAKADIDQRQRVELLAQLAAHCLRANDRDAARTLVADLIKDLGSHVTESEFSSLEVAGRITFALRDSDLAKAALKQAVLAAADSGTDAPRRLSEISALWHDRIDLVPSP